MKSWWWLGKRSGFWKLNLHRRRRPLSRYPRQDFKLTHSNKSKNIMANNQAIGLIETRGLVALVEGTDAMLKAANVELAGPMQQVGNALVTAVVVGDVAAVKAATDAGAQAIKTIKGELVSVHVIARPHADVDVVLPKKK